MSDEPDGRSSEDRPYDSAEQIHVTDEVPAYEEEDLEGHPERLERRHQYWRANLRRVVLLLGIWFAVSYGAGILAREPLDAVELPGTSFPLGFWFAQQGSIYVFVVLIFVYAWLMNRLDRRFDVDEQ